MESDPPTHTHTQKYLAQTNFPLNYEMKWIKFWINRIHVVAPVYEMGQDRSISDHNLVSNIKQHPVENDF